MDTNKKIQLIEQYIGKRLLGYVLNLSDDYLHVQSLNDVALSEQQTEVVDVLAKTIQECRIQHVVNGGFGDCVDYYLKSLKSGEESFYNQLRKHCNGKLPFYESNDELLKFLYSICVREYPNLLLKQSRNSFNVGLNINIGLSDYESFISLVKGDILNKITNEKDGFEYAFTFKAIDGIEFYTQVCTACSIIVSRSFQNACNKMSYSLNDVIREVDLNISILRNLAEGNEVEYSSFIGVKGAKFDGFHEIELGSSCLRQIDHLSNPSPHTNSIVVQHTNAEERYISGHIFDVKHKTKLAEVDADKIYAVNKKVYDIQEKALDSLKLALVFALKEDRGIAAGFSESGFPLNQPGNYSIGDQRPGKYLTITLDQVGSIQEWFHRFYSTDLECINVPLKRLKYAIFERSHAEDAIVDAIISWEGMFSEAFETSFKVTGSISKYLATTEERESFLNRLKKLYGLRSDLVHGKRSKFMNNENMDELRSEVIAIGIDAITKLLADEKLLKLTPAERVKEILIMRK
ncbi:hypothetical protein ACPFUO_003468 [Vibrio cholerae]